MVRLAEFLMGEVDFALVEAEPDAEILGAIRVLVEAAIFFDDVALFVKVSEVIENEGDGVAGPCSCGHDPWDFAELKSPQNMGITPSRAAGWCGRLALCSCGWSAWQRRGASGVCVRFL